MSGKRDPDIEGARILIETVLAERRTALTEMESKSLLASFHIDVTRTILARTTTEALMVGAQLGYPVAMKISSPDILHKSEVGGVALNVRGAADVRNRFTEIMANAKALRPDARIDGVTIQDMSTKTSGRELYIGVARDPLFGPVITFGAGGIMVEVIRDRSMELPPLNRFLARQLIERTRVARTLTALRGMPEVNFAALEDLLLGVSEMVCELPWLKEMDINPVIADEHGALAVDARILVEHAPPLGAGRHSHMAILPYPSHLQEEVPLSDGGSYTIRPIRPEDAEHIQDMMRGLSAETRYFRFFSTATEHSPRALARYTQVDYFREMALVAVHVGVDGRHRHRAHRRCRALPAQSGRRLRGVRRRRRRRLGGARPGGATDEQHLRGRAEQGHQAHRRLHSREELQHARADGASGLFHQAGSGRPRVAHRREDALTGFRGARRFASSSSEK